MKGTYNKLIKIAVWGTVILFTLRCFISRDSIISDFSLYEMWGYAGEAIGIAILFTVLYEKCIWKINPWERTPKLASKYKGTLSHHMIISKEPLI